MEYFLYLRKSRDKAEMADPDLLHKHRRELLRLAAARGQSVPPENIYEEKGSGDLLRTRPECRRLLETFDRLPRGAGGALWTTEVSRLTRGSLSDRGIVYEALVRPAVIHCTRDRDYDLHKATDLYYWETETAHARRELGVYKERVEAARLDMMLEGKIVTGKPPYGWWWDRNHKNADGSRGCVRPEPAQFAVVQALCRDALHVSTYQMAERYGLGQSMIHDLLRNPFLCGYPARRHFPHDGERHRRDTGAPWIYASHKVDPAQWLWPNTPGAYEPACTREEWDAIQRALDERRFTRCQTGTENAWSREAVRFLGYDRHARLAAKKSHRHAPSIPTYELSAPGRAFGIYIPRERVHAAVSAALVAFLADPDRMRRGREIYLARRLEATGAPADSSLADEILSLERRIDALLGRELDAAERRDAEDLASIQRTRADCKARLTTARVQAAALAASQPADDGIDALLDWPEFSPEAAREIWESAGLADAHRRVVTIGLIEAVLCCVEPVPGRQRWRREVVEVVFKGPWRARGVDE